jgi:hypothetical protein
MIANEPRLCGATLSHGWQTIAIRRVHEVMEALFSAQDEATQPCNAWQYSCHVGTALKLTRGAVQLPVTGILLFGLLTG